MNQKRIENPSFYILSILSQGKEAYTTWLTELRRNGTGYLY